MYICKLISVVLTMMFLPFVVETKNTTTGKGCYYKGSFHYGNWTDGCDFNCTCLDIDTGHYKCKTRCPVYPELPYGCVLKLPVGERCCRQPDCSAVTVPYTIITSNNDSHNKNNSKYNGDNRNVTSNNDNNGYNNNDTLKSNNYGNDNNNNNNNNNSNNIDNGNNNTNKNSYINDYNNNTDKNNNNNQSYINIQHSKESNSTFDNGDIRSINVSDNGDFNITFNNSGFNNNSAGQNNSINDYYFETIDSTAISNFSKALGGEENGCLYKGMYHYDNWTDGCNLNCTCEDPFFGTYRCRKRCREYPDLEPGCILKLSPEDHCCRVPVCNTTELIKQLENTNISDAINNTENYTNNINTKHELLTGKELPYSVIYKGNIGNNPNDTNTDNSVTENSKATVTPTTLPPIFVASAKTTTSLPKINFYNPKLMERTNMTDKDRKGYDIFNGANKANIENTEIVNATETEKLAIIFSRFGPVRLFTVKKDVNIEFTNKDKLYNEIHNVTEVFKHRDHHGQRQNIIQTKNFAKGINYLVTEAVCQYKGKTFQQDERWNDGCNLTCVCDNAARGIYKCRSRCTEYKALPIGCIMRESHVDSCCLVPDCRHATVASGNQIHTTSRIFSNIQQIGKTDKAMLKQMFNKRNQMRNKPSLLDKKKTTSVELSNNFQNVPIVIKASESYRRNLQHIIDQTKTSNTDLENNNKLTNSNPQNKNANLIILKRNKLTAQQQIVNPYNLIYSNRKNNRGTDTHVRDSGPSKGKQVFRNRSFRTIATQTGLYKVRKKDGVISSSRSRSVSNNVPNKLVGVSNSKTPDFCKHRGRRYNEGYKLFDGCERTCVCQSNGQFICKQRCPVYKRVPSGCALLSPRAGQCCSTLVCTRIQTRNNPPASYFNN